jgi:hypothetical protein
MSQKRVVRSHVPTRRGRETPAAPVLSQRPPKEATKAPEELREGEVPPSASECVGVPDDCCS